MATTVHASRYSRHFTATAALTSVLATLWTWHQRAAGRAALRNLDPHVVADIGLTQFDVAQEAGKPFWRP